jgi:photosystem II stability/assembly factor-like uncharacterized protein
MAMNRFSCALACLTAVGTTYGQWIPEQVPPDVGILLTVAFSPTGAGIAGGWSWSTDINGKALFSTDGGKTWLPAAVPDSTRALVTMISLSDTMAYGAGARNTGGIARTVPAVPGTPRGSIPLSVRRYNKTIGMTGTEGYTGSFMRSSDGGKHWHSFGTLPDSIFYLTGMCITAPTTIFATADASPTSGRARIIKSLDGGFTWSTLRLPTVVQQLREIAFWDCLSGAAIGYAVWDSSTVGVILRTSDGGDTWEALFDAGVGNFTGISFSTALTGYAVGTARDGMSPVAYKTSDGGVTWNTLAFSPDSVLVEGVRFLEGTGTGYIVGTKSGGDSAGVPLPWRPYIAGTTDGGLTWSTSEITGPHQNTLLIGAAVLSADEAFACGGDFPGPAVMLHTTNGGISGVNHPPGELPDGFVLLQNYPNPFNPVTTIQFTIVNRQLTRVNVYDVLGREVATLVNEVKEPGRYLVQWDASGMASGVYLYRLYTQTVVATRKLLLLR